MKKTVRCSLVFALLLAVIGIFSASRFFHTARAQNHATGAPETIPHRIKSNTGDAVTAGSTAQQTPVIAWNGGPIINTPTAYVIWYGNWNQTNNSDTAAGQNLVRTFLQNVGGSPYFMINSAYTGSNGSVTGNVVWGGETSVGYPNGSRLSDANILTIVNNAINSGKLPYNADGVYFVLTSSDVAERSGFCTQYCGWHTAGSGTIGHLRYSFVGNASRCLSACAAQTVSPNNNAGVDGMISVIAHELEEATTDPDPRSGWTNSSGSENADMCAWTFGVNPTLLPNGAYYNQTIGGLNFLIQRNLGTDSKCYTNWATKAQ